MIKRDPIVMIPGPTPVDPSILAAMDYQTYGHTYGDFVYKFKEALAGLKEIMMTDGEVVVVGGAGTLAMEMALVNTLKKDEDLLVISHGYFGDRFLGIAERYGFKVDLLQADPGSIVSPEQIAQQLAKKEYKAVTVTHVDTSTAVCAPIKEIGEILKGYPDTIYIVDGICATAGIEENCREWGIDVLVTTTQKAIGVPPGMAICGFSPKALARRKTLGMIPNYYCDLDLWLPIMTDPSKYFSTPPVNLILGLHQGVQLILEEGLSERFTRHKRYGRAIRVGIEALGLKILAQPAYAADTLTTIFYPEGVADGAFRAAMVKNGILVAGGVGPLAGKIFRIGHMGNITHQEILLTIGAVEMSLKELGYSFELGCGMAKAEEVLVG